MKSIRECKMRNCSISSLNKTITWSIANRAPHLTVSRW